MATPYGTVTCSYIGSHLDRPSSINCFKSEAAKNSSCVEFE
uniref:Uncharacterized protein n=1 Tax=Human betaherpesvirus 6 TaxID=10368 RepID=A0A5P9V260_9BETA|nr:hypothetical protein [Human betaherpesvirus 6]QFX28727.1 hypothetical protein [Human betaherpesvirus 6]QFX53662.1 hypothetical protein [Human betaherpesvirus 6]